MTTYHFPWVKYRSAKNLPCPTCGKKVRRQHTFEQTINPFNKNAEGQPKTRDEIFRELTEEAWTWAGKPEPCRDCDWNQS